jgi:hypothetical protein
MAPKLSPLLNLNSLQRVAFVTCNLTPLKYQQSTARRSRYLRQPATSQKANLNSLQLVALVTCASLPFNA